METTEEIIWKKVKLRKKFILRMMRCLSEEAVAVKIKMNWLALKQVPRPIISSRAMKIVLSVAQENITLKRR